MQKYGQVAILAAKRAQTGQDPRQAWAASVSEVFPAHPAARAKACPRSSFLALADAGLISGVSSGGEAHTLANGKYAVHAAQLLQASPELASSPLTLWSKTPGGAKQMHVVIALWQSALLVAVNAG